MRTLLSAIIFTIIGSWMLLAQSPAIEWQECLGGPLHDGGGKIKELADGDYLIVGVTDSTGGIVTGHHGQEDTWLVKISSTGGLLWEKAIGGTLSDGSFSMIEKSNGHIVIVGNTESSDGDIQMNHGGFDVWLVELDTSRSIIVSKTFGGTRSDFGGFVEATNDGGLIILGYSESQDGDVTFTRGERDWWLLKLDSSNAIAWQRTYGGPYDDITAGLERTPDGGYICAGSTRSIAGDISFNHGGHDIWVVKFDSMGIIQWEKTFGGSDTEFAYSISSTNDGGYVVGGFTTSSDGDVSIAYGYLDAWLFKIDATGNMEWEKSYGGSETEEIYAAEQANDGGYIFAGGTYSRNGDIDSTLVHGGFDQWLVKTDSVGNIEWQDWVGGSDWEEIFGFAQTSDGRLVTVGYTESSDGNVSCSNPISSEMFIVKYGQITEAKPRNVGSSFSVYPNPTVGKISFSDLPRNCRVSIFDSMGQIVKVISPNAPELSIDLSAHLNGTYFIRVEHSGSYTSKLVVLQK